jgi:hypothetical protein
MKKIFQQLGSSLLLTVLIAAQLTLASHDPTIRIELNPANHLAGQNSTERYEVKPSASADGFLTIKNGSDENTVSLKLYAVDSTRSTGGGIGFKLQSATQENLGQWIKFQKDEITVDPGKEIKVPFTITIPEKVTPGTYQGGLVAEVLNLGNVKRDNNSQIKIASRLIEPIIVSVPGRKILTYSLDQFKETVVDGIPGFQYSFHNTGNVFLKTEATLTLTGTLINDPLSISLNDATILQGDTYEENYKWLNSRFFGHYDAVLNLKISQYNVATGEMKEVEKIIRKVDFYIIPWTAILILLVIILIVGYIAYYCGRNCRIERSNTFIHKVKKGETITSIADLYQVEWHRIVHLNKLKKPYSLRAGKKIILPLPEVPPETLDRKND